MGSGRDAALEALTACRRLDAWSDGSMKAACRGLDRREAALCARLAYGVLQNRALLDFYLGSYCAFAKLEPFIRDVLRLGAYQILYMDRVPDSAAVNEAVETVKRKKRQRSAGLVNAVLRRLSREKANLPPLPAGDRADDLALRYSHPRWLVERLLDLLGGEEAEAFLRLDNESVPTAIQRNPLRCTAQELTDRLAESGGRVEPHPWLPDCWLLSGGGDLESMSAFQEGFFQIQDAAARGAARAAGPPARGPGAGRVRRARREELRRRHGHGGPGRGDGLRYPPPQAGAHPKGGRPAGADVCPYGAGRRPGAAGGVGGGL